MAPTVEAGLSAAHPQEIRCTDIQPCGACASAQTARHHEYTSGCTGCQARMLSRAPDFIRDRYLDTLPAEERGPMLEKAKVAGMTVRVIEGDCREVMAGMDEASVDAIVTDPPYELTSARPGGRSPATEGKVMKGFMGMAWDGSGVAFKVETWAEALRVLKPGGHLLAFSGTRTYHRMVCAIEDAGFEIRDMILYHYGSGFPKSLNLDNERGKLTCGCEDRPANAPASDAEHPVRDVRGARASAAKPCGSAQGDVLQLFLPGQGERVEADGLQRQHEGPPPGAAVRGGESSVEGRRHAQATEGQLQGGPLRSSAGVGDADGAHGRLHHGAPARDGGDVRLPADPGRSGGPRGPQPKQQRAEQSQALPDELGSQARGSWPICGWCGKPILPKGLGTALKPATEPIVLARKPLIGTVAANVLTHGTGALNIDGCRVGWAYEGEAADTDAKSRPNSRATGREQGEAIGPVGGAVNVSAVGRWPANIIHDGSEEVLAAFPQGVGGGHWPKARGVGGISTGGHAGQAAIDESFDRGSGSAARFFYTAKASAHDRTDGGQRVNGADKNHHPTVKPTELMRYLCRLVTPPGGTVLDPFMGSGSTLKAAELEGFSAIGIELDPAYIEIARRRIASDFSLFAEVAA